MEHPFHAYPKHLYHATLPPISVHEAKGEAEARSQGYGDTYIPQSFPMHVHKGDSVKVVNNSDELAAATAQGFGSIEGEIATEKVAAPSKKGNK